MTTPSILAIQADSLGAILDSYLFHTSHAILAKLIVYLQDICLSSLPTIIPMFQEALLFYLDNLIVFPLVSAHLHLSHFVYSPKFSFKTAATAILVKPRHFIQFLYSKPAAIFSTH